MFNLSQSEVLIFLKRNKLSWLSSREIAEGLDNGLSSVTINLQKLRLTEFIHFKKVPSDYGQSHYVYKWRE